MIKTVRHNKSVFKPICLTNRCNKWTRYVAAADHGACGFGPLQFGQTEHYSRPSSSRTVT